MDHAIEMEAGGARQGRSRRRIGSLAKQAMPLALAFVLGCAVSTSGGAQSPPAAPAAASQLDLDLDFAVAIGLADPTVRRLADAADDHASTCADEAAHRRRRRTRRLGDGAAEESRARRLGDGAAEESECDCRRRLASGASTAQVCAADDAAHRLRRRLAGASDESACAAAAHRRLADVDAEDDDRGPADDACECCAEAHHVDETPFKVSASLFGLLTLLVALSVFFEHMKEALDEKFRGVTNGVKGKMGHVVDKLFEEMTVLGFISASCFAISSTGILAYVSGLIFGDSDHGRHYLEHLLHTVHYTLFLVMVVFLIQVLFLCYFGQHTETEWRKMNRDSQDSARMHAIEKKWIESGGANCMSTANRYEQTFRHRALVFHAIRQEFISPRSVLPPYAPVPDKRLPESFHYAKYVFTASLLLRPAAATATTTSVTAGAGRCHWCWGYCH